MNHRVRDLYADVAVHATADREHQAAVDLLVLMMVVDHHIDDDELDEIRAISEDAGYESDTFSFDQYEGQAFAKVRAAVSSDGVDALLDDIDARIVNSVLRQALFSSARDVARVDGDIDEAEESLLGHIAARFG